MTFLLEVWDTDINDWLDWGTQDKQSQLRVIRQDKEGSCPYGTYRLTDTTTGVSELI